LKLCTPDRQARDARRAEGTEAVFLEGAGVGLHRHFAARRQRQARADVGQQPVDGRGRKQAGRAPANEDAVHLATPDQRQRGFQVGAQGVQVALLGQGLAAVTGVRVEVAVRAFAQAPGNVHVQRQRRQAAELQQPGAHVVLDVALRRGLRLVGGRNNGDAHGDIKTIAACACLHWVSV
jgi:hypothetical protein